MELPELGFRCQAGIPDAAAAAVAAVNSGLLLLFVNVALLST